MQAILSGLEAPWSVPPRQVALTPSPRVVSRQLRDERGMAARHHLVMIAGQESAREGRDQVEDRARC
jgi:hypothetical protein